MIIIFRSVYMLALLMIVNAASYEEKAELDGKLRGTTVASESRSLQACVDDETWI